MAILSICESRSMRGPIGLVATVLAVLATRSPAWADGKPAVKHPNLLLNRDEIEQVKAKIKQYDWAATLFQRVKELADDRGRTGRIPREAALVYVLTGEKRYGEEVRRALLGNVRSTMAQLTKFDPRLDPNMAPCWGPWAVHAWAYDLTYELFTDAERQQVEDMLRAAAQTIMKALKARSTTPNLVFEMHWKVGLVGYCLGDKELIEWGLNDPGQHGPSHGGFYQVLDTMIKDRYFWGEAPIYALHYDLHGMLALAEAARHYDGTDLYHHVSKKSGASIKDMIDGYLRLAYPLEKTGVGGGSLRMATFGDGSTSYGPQGDQHDTFLVNPVSGAFGETTLNGELEIAYKRYKDPGYAWALSLNPRRDQYIGSAGQGHSRPIWGFIALTHGEPLPDKPAPPPAPSGVYSSQGFAMLRSDESSRYWDSGGLAAVVRLGALVGHGHKDYFHLILHGKGRLLYPDINLIQYEPTWLNWTHEGICHNTLLVDQQSPRPGPSTTRQDFTPEAKFFAITGSAFDNVAQTRALLMTNEYLADVFRAADTRGQQRSFDWVLHGLGRLYPGNPSAYRPTNALVPFYWWIDNERGRKTDTGWQVDWVQKSAGVTPGVQRFGKEWFENGAGVRMTMLGAPGSEVFVGDGPIVDGPPHHRLDGSPEASSPLVVARRQASATAFAAVHEPYQKHSTIRRVRRIQETEEAVGIAIESPTFSDRVLMAYTADRNQALRSADGEAFAFRDHGYVRVNGDRITARGQLQGLRLRTKLGKLTINGKEQAGRRDGDFLVFGTLPPDASGSPARPAPDEPREHAATVHYSLLPEEVHLRAGGAKEATLHIYCSGLGEAQGRLRLRAPKGITVEPTLIDLGRMKEGDERSVRVRVKAAEDAVTGLHDLHIEPEGDTPATAGKLLVSVGLVLTEDKRLPRLAQWIVRAPGYTMKVDHTSGVSYYLLDGDGHRRHGRIHNTNACFGLPGIERDGQWLFRYGIPCRFVWDGKNTLTIGCAADRQNDARLRYTFHEDRIVLTMIPPTNPTLEQTMWLGNFDVLGPPRHNGTQKRPGDPIMADWVFFPHPIHRQGLLVNLPPKTDVRARGAAVSFPVRAGKDVTLRFATEEEVEKLVKE
jgi:hypothetical protein